MRKRAKKKYNTAKINFTTTGTGIIKFSKPISTGKVVAVYT